jgi:biotin synthase
MVALARIMLPLANIAATTALQALHPFGRELGLESGANILMPLVTPQRVRAQYQLYDGKPCIDDELDECRDCLAARVSRTRREVGYHQYGDSLIPVRPDGGADAGGA